MTWLGKIFKGQLGWKTVTSALVIAVVVVLQNFGVITTAQVDSVLALAAALGLVGLRDAISKLK